MEVKKFRAPTIQEATNMVRKMLGPDALILSTRKLDEKRAMGRSLFEICAVAGKRTPVDSSEGKLRGAISFDAVQTELNTIKEILFSMSGGGILINRIGENPRAIDLYVKLIRGGISEYNARVFLKTCGAFENGSHADLDDLYKKVFNEIIKAIPVADPFEAREKQVVAALVGPTGVGKTTTVAKLVADIHLRQKRSVGLISIDNYRIGAMEQLKTYAAILGVPCFPAFSCDDLEFALKRLAERDVVLIDTAGQSHYDIVRMDELAGLLRSNPAIECHLLLAASTNESEIETMAKNFSKLDCSSYIFTKIDETNTRGVIINQILKSEKPVSYVTTGQRVPEDIMKATKTGILNLIFQ